MAHSIEPMLSLADIYFTDGNDKFRFQWSTQAIATGTLNYPQYDGDDDYKEFYQKLTKYNQFTNNINNELENAVSFTITIYDMSGNFITSKTVTSCEAEFNLNDGEYLWNVSAYDANGDLITTSDKAYFFNPSFYDYDDEKAAISYQDSSSEHQIAEIESIHDTWSNYYIRKTVIGKIITGDSEAYFSVCGPGEGDDITWTLSQNGGFSYSLSNSFGGFENEFHVTQNCLVTETGSIYEYENGKWVYKFLSDFEPVTSSLPTKDYFLNRHGNLYEYNCSTDQLEMVDSISAIEFSNRYFLQYDGVYSLEDKNKVLDYTVAYGENLIFDDMFFNIFAQDAYGNMTDALAPGQYGSIVVKYFLFDQKNNEIIEKEEILFRGSAPYTLDTEEMYASRIGNCVCFVLQDEGDDDNGNWNAPTTSIFIHEFQNDGTIVTHSRSGNIYDSQFTTDKNGQLVCYYYNGYSDSQYSFNIDLNFDTLFTDGSTPGSGGTSGSTTANSNKISFENLEGDKFIVEYSPNKFSSVIRFDIDTKGVDTFNLPNGEYSVRVSADNGENWAINKNFTANNSAEPKKFTSTANDNLDVFFANASGKWTTTFMAQHMGSVDGNESTGDKVAINGKNRFADIFSGSEDKSILVLTDDDNGDAIFLEDIYSDLPNNVARQQARVANIDEIRAGAGDDLIDMTSQKFEYTDSGMTIYGGNGNDVIWANIGQNYLFGGAGNDQIVGNIGDDIIVGGKGNDTLSGGGGGDIYVFNGNFGNDVIKASSGTITLHFDSTNVQWDERTQSYTDGTNSVKVEGSTNVYVSYNTDYNTSIKTMEESASDTIYSKSIFVSAEDTTTYIGTATFGWEYDNVSDEASDNALKTYALIDAFETTKGNNTVYINTNTWSWVESDINFNSGNDTLVIPEEAAWYYGSGLVVRGDLNFGSGNNKIENNSNNGGLYAHNMYFGDGDNTIICKTGQIEIGVHYVENDGEHSYIIGGTGEIVFGDGENYIKLADGGEICGSNITFGDGGNTLEIIDDSYFGTESYFEDDYNTWYDTIKENGGITKITFGSGEDEIKISGSSYPGYEDYYGCLSTFELNMGGGDDSITLNSGGEIFIMSGVDDEDMLLGGCILMGDGNDTLTLNQGCSLNVYGRVDFGNDDDTLVIGYGADIEANATFDFGSGDDTLVLNGTLRIYYGEQLTNFENVSGSGNLIINGWAEDEFIEKFESAGINVEIASWN